MPPNRDYVPQLATLVATPPQATSGCTKLSTTAIALAHASQGTRVALHVNGNDWTAAFPEIAQAVDKLGLDDALIDGEAAVVLPDGRTSFQALQNTSVQRFAEQRQKPSGNDADGCHSRYRSLPEPEQARGKPVDMSEGRICANPKLVGQLRAHTTNGER